MLRRLWPLGIAALACQPGAEPPTSPALRSVLLTDMVGGWRWQWRTTEAGTTRVESETWRLRPMAGVPTQLIGRYVRDVEVRSDDRVPFGCNQRPWYRQRAVFDVTVEPIARGFAIHETDYRAEPSPCDHGFRHLGAYTSELGGNRLTLRWDDGAQTLWQIDDELTDLPAAPWPATPELAGAWRWDATSYDDAGNLRDEHEWWELTRRSDTRIDATYRRQVTIRSPDGSSIACAGAPSWSFDDAYVLDGQREEEHWHFYELAVDAGSHPCLAATPTRSLDEATAEQIGDYLVLEWRGKRHQVLYRPE
ncbi:MAG TPA: hypothetical protein VH165_01475 [Kofleriaceae bacterium]|jgi:hypothetical protein|nr:hypothetical protein [Kofleriaceae bacterium]